MFKNFFDQYPHYELVQKVDERFIASFSDRLPEPILEFWRQYGWGIFMNGYLRFVNPIDFQNFSDEYVEKTSENDQFIPFAVTAFGDLLGYANRGKIELYDFRHANFEVLSSSDYLVNFINKDLVDQDYIWEELRAEQYKEAVRKLGVPAYDQCFGYVPLLALGGNESVDKLQLVNLQVHMELMAQTTGVL